MDVIFKKNVELCFFPLQEAVVTEYLNNGNANDAVNTVREMRAPKHFIPEMLSKVILQSLDRSDEDKEKASTLISLLKQEGIATSDNFMQVLWFDNLAVLVSWLFLVFSCCKSSVQIFLSPANLRR